MRLMDKKKFEQSKVNQEMITEAAAPDQPEAAPDQPEIILSDGQTDQIPDPVIMDAAENQSSDAPFLGLPTTTTNNRYYTKNEFQEVFNSFFEFLKDPNAAADCFGTIQSKGLSLAANRFYDLAAKYKWLNWIIDKNTAILHDAALISIWAATEANIIILNWTGISLFEKGQLWLKTKIKAKAEAEAAAGNRSVWGFLGRRAAAKQQKQEI